MKPGARIQACIELLDEKIISKRVPADRLIYAYLKTRRYIGSQDRRALSDLFFDCMRYWPRYEAIVTPLTGRLGMLLYLLDQKKDINSLFNGDRFCPATIDETEKAFLKQAERISICDATRYAAPVWLWDDICDAVPDENARINLLKSCLTQAPLDLRVNPLKTTRDQLIRNFMEKGLIVTETPFSPLGVRSEKRFDISNDPLFETGHVEIQDEGSQIVALLTDAKPGQRVLDFCAGAGGKSLLLAAQMNNKGSLTLTDIYEWRLKNARVRLKRADIHNYATHCLPDRTWIKRQKELYDRVLVDVPCSGTGTWRRNPDLKSSFTADERDQLLKTQQDILKEAAQLVKKGGRLIYATCSFLRAENHRQMDTFLQNNKEFSPVPIKEVWSAVLPGTCPVDTTFLQLLPSVQGTDGFFVAVLERTHPME